MNALVPTGNGESFRQSTDAAGLCKEIVLKTATKIQGRRYVTVEGWQAIAIAHGCTASADHVERVEDEGCSGFKAIGSIRRMSDGQEIARAEGFLGDDEGTWSKRPVYARRAMTQTRAISRACRSAFAHVVVMMDAGLMTTPEVEMVDPETGEVIVPINSGPPARTKLDGPHTSKSALKKAIHELTSAVLKAETNEAIDKLLKAAKPTLKQAEEDWPALVTGNPDIPEDIGLKGAVEQRRQTLEQDGQFKMLVDSLNECETKQQLINWLERNGDVAEALDGAESRSFELAYQLRESIINEMDKVTS